MERTADGRRRWRQWSEPEAREALAELAHTDESIGVFARRKGVSRQRLHYWRKRLGEGEPPALAAYPVATEGGAQIEIASDVVTVRVREDVRLDRLAERVELVGRRVREC